MTATKRKRNTPLTYLRQVITDLNVSDNDIPLVLYLAAVKCLSAEPRFSLKSNADLTELKRRTDSLQAQLVDICHKEIASHLAISDSKEEVRRVIWSALQNKRLESLWLDETTLGYIYLFLCLPKRSLSLANLDKSDKVLTAETLVSFTQLYTPNWVAEYLLQKTITGKNFSLEAATILDPACGAGHFLVKAFDLLHHQYIQEGLSTKDASRRILSHNLSGADIDAQALAVTALSLLVKSLKSGLYDSSDFPGLLNLSCTTNSNPLKNLLGSLNRDFPADHPLGKKYKIVVTNPPYIGRKLLDRQLKQALKTEYPCSHNDLANAFLERSMELVEPAGMIGVITQATLISLPSYSALRQTILENTLIDTCVELGPGVFPMQGGEKINSLLLVLQKEVQHKSTEHTARFIDARNAKDKAQALVRAEFTADECYTVSQRSLAKNENYVFNYRCPPIVAKLLHKANTLSTCADIRQGLATTDNERFLRFWWDVDKNTIGKKWFPYAKGAGVRRWHNPIRHLVNWEDNGQEIKDAVVTAYPYLKGNSAWVVKNEKYYFRHGLTFSFIGGQDFSVRYLPSGCIFDVAGSAIFVDDNDLFSLLAYLNSSFIRAVAGNLNPSINFQVGDLKKLPVVEFTNTEKETLSISARKCFANKAWLNSLDPTCFSDAIPDQLSAVLSGASMESAWLAYSQQQEMCVSQLQEEERNINQIVLNAVFRSWQLTEADSSVLAQWIGRQASKTSQETIDKNTFAKTCLYHLLFNQVSEKSLVTFSTDTYATDLPFSNEQKAWLSSQLKSSLSNYLVNTFNTDHGKQFLGSPILFCQPVAGNGHARLFSSQSLRKIDQQKNANIDQAALNMLESLSAKMSSITDWTGRDLVSAL